MVLCWRGAQSILHPRRVSLMNMPLQKDEFGRNKHAIEARAEGAKKTSEGYAQHVEAVGKDKYEQLKVRPFCPYLARPSYLIQPQASGNETLADARVRAQAESAHARDYIGDAQKQAHQSYEHAKDYAAQSTEAARQRAAEARDAASAKYNEAAGAVEGKYEEARDALTHKYANARAEAERNYGEAKSRVSGAYDDAASTASAKWDATKGEAHAEAEHARRATEAAEEKAKQGWFSWLGWGRQKADDAAWKKDEAKRDAAGKLASGAEDVRGWAEDKQAETRPEKADAVKRADRYSASV